MASAAAATSAAAAGRRRLAGAASPAATRSRTADRSPGAARRVAGGPAGPDQIAPTIDTRQRARWLLHEAREQLHLGNYDEAQRKADEAEALNVKWGLFDDTPAKVGEEIKKARPKAVAARAAAPARSTTGAPPRPSSARRALRSTTASSSRPRRSRSRSRAGGCPTVSSRTIPTRSPPRPVPCGAATRSAIRRRETNRARVSTTSWCRNRVSSSQVGKLDEAEAKARQAQRMNVVPSLTSDRAESVLHEIAMARAAEGASRRLRHSPARAAADARAASWSPSAKPTRCSPRVTRPPTTSRAWSPSVKPTELLAEGATRPPRPPKFVEADRLGSG